MSEYPVPIAFDVRSPQIPLAKGNYQLSIVNYQLSIIRSRVFGQFSSVLQT